MATTSLPSSGISTVSQIPDSTFSLTELLTAASATATASSTDGMDGMSMGGMDNATTVSNLTTTGVLDGMTNGTTYMMDDNCKISMLWNWETINACFLSKSWQIHSRGAFAGLCIGVIFLVIFLEFLRRMAKAYDRHLIREHHKTVTLAAASSLTLASAARTSSASTASGSLIPKEHEHEHEHDLVPVLRVPAAVPFRPSVAQQATRALLHTLQFATAYWIMLLAMYYNGYIIICIIIGAFIGSFIFQWERIGPRSRGDGVVVPGCVQDTTGCCG